MEGSRQDTWSVICALYSVFTEIQLPVRNRVAAIVAHRAAVESYLQWIYYGLRVSKQHMTPVNGDSLHMSLWLMDDNSDLSHGVNGLHRSALHISFLSLNSARYP